VDADGVVRRALNVATAGDTAYFSLGYLAARSYLAKRGIQERKSNEGLPQLGQWKLVPFGSNDGGYRGADDAGYQTLINFAVAPRAIPSATLSDVIDGRASDDLFKGRVVEFGVVAPSLPDVFQLPIATTLDQPAGTPGVALQAMMMSQAIRFALGESRPLRVTPNIAQLMILAIVTFGAALLIVRTESIGRLAIGIAAFPVTLVAMALVALLAGVWIPVGVPGLASLFSGGAAAAALAIVNKRERAALMGLFARHLSPQLAENVWRRRNEFLEGGRPRPQRLEVTVLFADLKGYTTMAEHSSPDELMDWINTFSDAMAAEIMSHGGVIDDYAGDGIKADWGVPLARETESEVRRDAEQAVNCALAMEGVLTRLNQRWLAEGKPTGAMRIGIASGEAIAGSIGGRDRLKYTVVGDVVNVAARLESLNTVTFDSSVRTCRILIDARTRAYLPDDISCEPLGEHPVKGRGETVSIFRVSKSPSRV
jgi:adenylate cyclase